MKYKWLENYCLAKAGVVKTFKEEWGMTSYRVGNKPFASVHGDKSNKPIVTLKLDPFYSEEMREQYSDVVPGYYHNHALYSSVYLDGGIADEVLQEMINHAYLLVFSSLTKKLQEDIKGEG